MYLANKLWLKETLEGAEVETSELLGSIVRHQKPTNCLETGTAHGQTAEAIGKALKANGRGMLHTCDTDSERVLASTKRVEGLPVTIYCQKGIDFINETEMMFDLVFIDSWWWPIRAEEVAAVVHKINPGGFLCLHDVAQNYYNVYEEAIKTGWPSMVFHAPYGLAVLRRPSDDDWSGVGKMVTLEPID